MNAFLLPHVAKQKKFDDRARDVSAQFFETSSAMEIVQGER
jgi:hypothetical protein